MVPRESGRGETEDGLVKSLAVIGASGFVGSAFVREAATAFEVTPVTRESYAALRGTAFDVVIDAAANSRKYLADEDPLMDFRLSVEHRLNTLLDFPARVHVHVSSVDVYEDLTSPETTREDRVIDPARTSRYGFHKLLAEELVRHYAKEWLIVRLAGMVGPGLRKNPVFDILRGLPLRIHPDSRYQYMATDEAAAICLSLLKAGERGRVFNVCGDGLISPREIADLSGRTMNLAELKADAVPRVVEADTESLRSRGLARESVHAVRAFLER